MRHLAFALCCLLAACTTPPAPAPTPIIAEAPPVARCVSPERIKASAPSVARVVEIDAPAAFLAALNAIPPKTDAEADRIIVAHIGEAGRIFLFNRGCLIDPAGYARIKAEKTRKREDEILAEADAIRARRSVEQGA